VKNERRGTEPPEGWASVYSGFMPWGLQRYYYGTGGLHFITWSWPGAPFLARFFAREVGPLTFPL